MLQLFHHSAACYVNTSPTDGEVFCDEFDGLVQDAGSVETIAKSIR